jgi:hypothetical protein
MEAEFGPLEKKDMKRFASVVMKFTKGCRQALFDHKRMKKKKFGSFELESVDEKVRI